LIEQVDSISRYFADIPEFRDVQKVLREVLKKREELGEHLFTNFHRELISLRNSWY